MTEHSPASDNFWLLLDAACDGRLEETQLDEMATFLESDAESRSLFADHVQLRTDIRLLCMADRSSEAGLARVAGRLRASAEGPEARNDETAADSPRVIHPSSFTLHRFAALESLAGGVVLSYLAAVALLGAGVLLAGAWRTGIDRSSLARAKAETVKGTSGAPAFVARITKAQDCQRGEPGPWAADPWAADGPLLRLGYQCYVKAGQLEITYNTGAKVTLQGPAWYEVSSAGGGSLYEGTAAISVAEQANGVSPKRAAAREIASHPLFTLHTPIGFLTIQAAEFSLTVDGMAAFFAKVNRGQIALQMPGWGPDKAVAVPEAWSAVTFIRPQSHVHGFQWEVHLSGDRPLLVDSDPHRRDRPPIVFSGQCPGSIGKWGLERRPGDRSGS